MLRYGRQSILVLEKLQLLEEECLGKQAEIDSLKKDRDDLLELLSDQEIKLNSFKKRLIDLGDVIIAPESDNVSVASEA